MYNGARSKECGMGGIGSGARRQTKIANVENTLTLDVRRLRRLGLIRTGVYHRHDKLVERRPSSALGAPSHRYVRC